ncbi:MAG: hypothetical protein AABY64_09825 [Bdellovibrionota bacterium]
MKTGLIIFSLFISIYSQAETYDACYTDARKNGYNIQDASQICKGMVSDTCYKEARDPRQLALTVQNAANVCRNVTSDVCYLDARKVYAVKLAANACRGLISAACYTEVRKKSFNILDAVTTCRAGVVCQDISK